jgi:hypothetical protein
LDAFSWDAALLARGMLVKCIESSVAYTRCDIYFNHPHLALLPYREKGLSSFTTLSCGREKVAGYNLKTNEN